MAINRRKLTRLERDLDTCFMDAVTLSQSRGIKAHQEVDFNKLANKVLQARDCARAVVSKYVTEKVDGQ